MILSEPATKGLIHCSLTVTVGGRIHTNTLPSIEHHPLTISENSRLAFRRTNSMEFLVGVHWRLLVLTFLISCTKTCSVFRSYMT